MIKLLKDLKLYFKILNTKNKEINIYEYLDFLYNFKFLNIYKLIKKILKNDFEITDEQFVKLYEIYKNDNSNIFLAFILSFFDYKKIEYNVDKFKYINGKVFFYYLIISYKLNIKNDNDIIDNIFVSPHFKDSVYKLYDGYYINNYFHSFILKKINIQFLAFIDTKNISEKDIKNYIDNVINKGYYKIFPIQFSQRIKCDLNLISIIKKYLDSPEKYFNFLNFNVLCNSSIGEIIFILNDIRKNRTRPYLVINDFNHKLAKGSYQYDIYDEKIKKIIQMFPEYLYNSYLKNDVFFILENYLPHIKNLDYNLSYILEDDKSETLYSFIYFYTVEIINDILDDLSKNHSNKEMAEFICKIFENSPIEFRDICSELKYINRILDKLLNEDKLDKIKLEKSILIDIQGCNISFDTISYLFEKYHLDKYILFKYLSNTSYDCFKAIVLKYPFILYEDFVIKKFIKYVDEGFFTYNELIYIFSKNHKLINYLLIDDGFKKLINKIIRKLVILNKKVLRFLDLEYFNFNLLESIIDIDIIKYIPKEVFNKLSKKQICDLYILNNSNYLLLNYLDKEEIEYLIYNDSIDIDLIKNKHLKDKCIKTYNEIKEYI